METSDASISKGSRFQEIKTTPRNIFFSTCVFIISLTIMSTLLPLLKFSFHINNRALDFLISIFYMDKENNIPTYFSSLILLAASILLIYVSIEKFLRKDRFRFQWALLAGGFLLMSMDEFMSIHERMIDPLRESLNLGGWFYFAWIIPGFLFVCILGLLFLPFIFRLKSPVRMMFILSGAIYIGGALGIEALGGFLTENYGQRNIYFVITANLEETLELLGIAYFIYALLIYIQNELRPRLKVKIYYSTSEKSEPEKAPINTRVKNKRSNVDRPARKLN